MERFSINTISSDPTAPNIEVPRLRELPVSRLNNMPGSIHGLPLAPALDMVRMERFSINTISSLGLSRTPETVLEFIEARPATVELPKMRELPVRVDVDVKGGAMPEISSPAQRPASSITLPHLEPGELAVTSPRLGQPDVLKQLPATEVELLKPLATTTLGQVARIPQASEPRLRTAEILDVNVKTLERMGFDVKQMTPPELQELTMPALPPTTRTPARTGRTARQELRLPSLTTELRKLKLHRWEWELPEWGKGLRKLLNL
jgi:hypothetical protein